ncbi:MAG: pyridoxal-phosphate dependent enzyme [Candidatus Cloacimonetes bacterium]|nr:pyridoxal-phosphate dependent enzyme [Candidatus Cloacimonadota bacterium]
MSKILPKLNEEIRLKTAQRCKERNIIIPTFTQLRDPETIPADIKNKLANIGLWDVDPLNLFRITWKNNTQTGLFGAANYLEIPSELSGVKARIIGLVGKYFPTGSHKVGAAFGCLVPRMISGEFDPTYHKAVWPSTGNYCRGGAFDCALLACDSIAILPEEMSQERFDWLHEIGAQVIATPGCESNVKEIYDKCHELRKDPQNMIFNQFSEFGNPYFHYHVTAPAVQEVFQSIANDKSRLTAFVSSTGSAGTIAAADYLKKIHPLLKTVAVEAWECPTLLYNGFGGHRIEGIGDKHVPWVHNVRSTDLVAAIKDEDCMRLLRLFNEDEGRLCLLDQGVSQKTIYRLSLLGISSICNLLATIKLAKYFELDNNDVIFTMFTDSAELYQSRLLEQQNQKGDYSKLQANIDFEGCLKSQVYDNLLELSYWDKKRIHNLKYYTWIEQQGMELDELNAQWSEEYWTEIYEDDVERIEQLIVEFNKIVASI